MSSTTHSTALPSTPNSIGRSSNLFGKVLNKLRTPTGGDGVNGANSHENQNSTPKRSFSPMMGRRSSSKSSLRMFGSSSRAGNVNSHPLPSSSTNTSTSSLALPHPNNSSLEFDDDDDSLDLPQFESDKYAPSTTASNRASSPYSRNFPSSSSLASVAAAPASTDVASSNQHQLPPRPSTSMSTRSRAGSASNGTGSAGSGWKSALLGRSTGAVGARSASVASQASQIEGNEGMSSSWSKSKNLAKSFGRSTGGEAAREARNNEAASEEVTHKVVQHSSPNVSRYCQIPSDQEDETDDFALPFHRTLIDLLSQNPPARLDLISLRLSETFRHLNQIRSIVVRHRVCLETVSPDLQHLRRQYRRQVQMRVLLSAGRTGLRVEVQLE